MAWKRVLIGIGLVGLVSAVAVIAGLSLVRGAGPVPEESLALQRLALPPGQGENAFDALWLLEYPVPGDERAAIVEADAMREQAWLDALDTGEADLSDAQRRTGASARYPRQAPDEREREAFCGSDPAEPCLRQVREHAAHVDAVLARYAPLLDRIEALEGYGHLRNRFPDHMSLTLPPYQLILLARTRDARRFALGETGQAMDGLCRRATALRRLAADSDQVIFHLIALRSATDYDARLFAEMLAELPAGAPIPPACDVAFAPMTMAEAEGFCRVFQGEFALWAGTLRRSHGIDAAAKSRFWRLADWFVYDPEHTIARVAMHRQGACAPELAQAILDDGPIGDVGGISSSFTLRCLANYFGCVLADISAGPIQDYARRLQDARARVGLVRAVVALRRARMPGLGPSTTDATGLPVDPLAVAVIDEGAFARAAAEPMSEARHLRLSEGGRSARIDLFGGAETDARGWQIPLPPVLWPQAAAGNEERASGN